MESIVPVDVQNKASEIEKFAAAYENYAIETADKFQTAAQDLQAVKSKAKELDAKRKSLTAPLDETRKGIMDFFRRPLEVLANAEAAIKKAMTDFQAELARKQRAEQDRLNRIAEQEENKRRAEKECQEREWRAKEEAKRQEAARLSEEASKMKSEQDKQVAWATADKLRREADAAAAKAAERQQQAAEVHIEAPVVAKTEVSAAGIQMRENWKFRIIDVNKIPRELLIPDEKKLGEIAKANKSLAKVDGIEFYNEPVIAAGSR
jgi:hypothetical protein